MKKIFCCLLIAVLVLGTFAGCKKQNTPPTETTGAKQVETISAVQKESTQFAQTEATGTAQPDNTEAIQPEPTEATKTEDKEEDENPYGLKEVTDYRVKIQDNQKVFDSYPYFAVAFPADWKCFLMQHEDGSNYYFRDPVLDDKCQLSISIFGSYAAKECTEEEYRKLFSSHRDFEDVVIESVTKETIDNLQGTKVVYSYTYEGTRYIRILYDNFVDRLRAFDLQINFPADQKDTYEPIFAAIIDSTVLYRYTL